MDTKDKKMIMKALINKMTIGFLLLGSILSIYSCKKTEEPTEAPRIFKVGEPSLVPGENSAKISWLAPLISLGRPYTYQLDFATDPQFANIIFTTTTQALEYVVTEANLKVRVKYYVRIKALATADQPESKYVVSSQFSLTGTQLFGVVRENDIKETTVKLWYTPTVGLSSIVLTPATGTPTTIALSTADAASEFKLITGLTPGVKYDAELFAGTSSKGFLTFTTLAPTTYTKRIFPTDDLNLIIQNSVNNDVIGLNPGTYTLSAATNSIITGRSITLKSISGDPKDTKVNYKQFDLEGTGAGLTLSGIELDGTLLASGYFINFIGSQAANSSPATFTNVLVDNCIVHGSVTAFIRGDRGAAAGDFKITGIAVNNSIVYDMGANGTSTYYAFNITKMQFSSLTISKSTFYNFGPGLVLASTVVPGSAPTVSVTNSTLNGFGGSSKYALLDANANPVNFTIQNSIFSNTPRSGTIAAAAIRSTTGTSTILNSNYFNFYSTGTTPLTFGTAVLTNNQTITLPWTATTSDFTLPAGSALRTASSTGGPIGDPRWSY